MGSRELREIFAARRLIGTGAHAGVRLLRFLWVLPVAAALGACEGGTGDRSESRPAAQPAAKQVITSQNASRAGMKRWYSEEQVDRGERVFAEKCAGCHGKFAQGAFAWRRRGPDGKYPAPPLNGTGHAWHHSLRALHHTIRNALPPGQGRMPPFRDVLSDEQILDVIAWFQSKWPDEIYRHWAEIDQRSATRRR